MTVDLRHDTEDQYLHVRLTGKLHKEDYEQFLPEAERLIKEHGKIRILVELHDFHGWSAGALWEDIKFDFKHFNDIERLAIVGESKWHEGMAWFCKPFTTAKVRYFGVDEAVDAREWIRQE